MKLKKILILLGTSIALIFGIGWQQSTAHAFSYKARYTNPQSLRSHKYWYGYSNSYTGKWGYERIHFAKHSVYFAEKTYKSGHWKKSHITEKAYFIQRLKSHGWYSFGTRASDDVNLVKINHRYLGHSKHVVLSVFDPSNDNGGYKTHAPFRVWDYTTRLKWAKGWYYKINKAPQY